MEAKCWARPAQRLWFWQHRLLSRSTESKMPRRSMLGKVAELTFPQAVTDELAEVLADWRIPLDTVLSKLRRRRRHQEWEARGSSSRVVRNLRGEDEEPQRIAVAHVQAWERGTSRTLPPGHVVVFIDGDQSNIDAENLYCLPRRQLIAWMKFVRHSTDSYVDRMKEEIMSLDTSEAVKKELLHVLDQLVDPNQKPDVVRQRAICETVQTLVGLLKVEVAYIRAIEGDAVVPFLEDAHKEAIERRTATKDALFSGPRPNHPWRGLGGRGKG